MITSTAIIINHTANEYANYYVKSIAVLVAVDVTKLALITNLLIEWVEMSTSVQQNSQL